MDDAMEGAGGVLIAMLLGIGFALIGALPVMFLSWLAAEYMFAPEVFRSLEYWPAYFIALAITWTKALT